MIYTERDREGELGESPSLYTFTSLTLKAAYNIRQFKVM
jgi:hypothetical protein